MTYPIKKILQLHSNTLLYTNNILEYIKQKLLEIIKKLKDPQSS